MWLMVIFMMEMIMVGEFGLCWCKCIVCFDEIVVFVGVSMIIVDCVLNECGSVFV